ncbi:MAG: glycosyltransferase [Rivularia sp. T60_A2020_040]|nr:glycosyltransferase [Rivularia sp. T60_A2020_040]
MNNNTKPVISVIIPAYNAAKTIQETVMSVLNQSFSNLELIVINDGSQDSTLEVLSTIKDSRLQVFSYENAGVCMARNRGIERASGEFISFLDADDIWTPDKLEAQLTALEKNPQAGVAYSWVDYIDEYGNFFHPGNPITINGSAYEKMLVQNILENGSNPLIRREALTEVGGFDPSLTLAEDWDMWLRLSERYDFVTVPSVQILYRTSSRSASTNIVKMENSCLKLIEKSFKNAPASLQYLKKNTLSTLYHYLTFKSLESPLSRKNGIIAMGYFWNVIKNDSSTIWQWQTMSKALFKISTVLILPPAQYKNLKTIVKKLLIKEPANQLEIKYNEIKN